MERRGGSDVRALALGAAAWLGAIAGGLVAASSHPWWLGALAGAVVALLGTVARRVGAPARPVLALVLVAVAVGGQTWVRLDAVAHSTVAERAPGHAVGVAVVDARSDPVVRPGRFGDVLVLRATTVELSTRGTTTTARVPVLVLGDPGDAGWDDVTWGTRIRLTGRLTPSDEPGTAALLDVVGPPTVVRPPPAALRTADIVRASVRRAAAGAPGEAKALVPALVTGDDQALSERLQDDFRTTGLTHLTAVSGTNLTLVLAFLLVLARAAGVRARGLLVVGLLGVGGFVLLARPEPSVLRAAAMGVVALLGMHSRGRAAGTRALGVATLALLVLDPPLATSAGFALSVLATAGILLVGPPARDALAGWMPRVCAEAIAVPLAAQLACTPLVAGLSGQVSLVAVLANLVVAPAVGPATVLGLVGGILGLLVPWAGAAVGWVGGCAAWWIVAVAERGARLPTAAVGWPTGLVGLTVLSVLCLVALGGADRLLRRRGPTVAAAVLLLVVLLVPLPGLDRLTGWPPRGWVMVMCDVGQGDGLVLAAGPRSAVVVDAGPDPALIDACLRRLGVSQVPAVVLTHFHADHVDGLPGVLRGRTVGEVLVSPLRLPEYGAHEVDQWLAGAGVPERTPAYQEVDQVGPLRWTVVSPQRVLSDSPNDASLALLVETHGLRLLLAGDVEPPSQQAMETEGLAPVDVLKVPHHGSRYQDPALLASLGAHLALVSVGADNDYGHPAASTLQLLEAAGMVVRRTDRDGDLAVVDQAGRLLVVPRG